MNTKIIIIIAILFLISNFVSLIFGYTRGLIKNVSKRQMEIIMELESESDE